VTVQAPNFKLFSDIPIDPGHTLDQLGGGFQTIQDGVPELIKNSKDQYARLGVADRAERQVVVIASSVSQALAVLDFAGAGEDEFAGWFKWSSRTAGRTEKAADIEAGYGNGGKFFMVHGSIASAFMESCADGLRTCMGFDNTDPTHRYRPGYALEGGREVKGLRQRDPKDRLSALLNRFGMKYQQLPRDAQRVFNRRRAFTWVEVAGLREFEGKRRGSIERSLRELPSDLLQHAQAALTVETCSVWVTLDRELLTTGPLEPLRPEPLQGFEDLATIPVPTQLVDPKTNDVVQTGASEETNDRLALATSAKPLRYRDELRVLNYIRVRDARNVVANWSVADLAPRPEAAFILGTLWLAGLPREQAVGAGRSQLADTALTRALRAWVSQQVDDLATAIQRVQARSQNPEDRDKANEALKEFRELMRKYLEGEGPPPPPEGRIGSRVDEIVLEQNKYSLSVASGTRIPLLFKCYEVDRAGERSVVPSPDVEMLATPENVFEFDRESRTIRALASGRADVKLRDTSTGVESDSLEVESVTCSAVALAVPDRKLLQGERVHVTAVFQTSNGPRRDLMLEGTVDEPELGTLGRSGFFTADHMQGVATLRVRYGPELGDTDADLVEIGSQAIERANRDRNGPQIPLILMCGTEAQGMEDLPPEQRTHRGGEYHPTIIEEPTFPNIIWVNGNSKEALRVRQSRGGSSGIGSVATKTFTQFLALKCFEILKTLKVRDLVRTDAITELQYRNHYAHAEIECASFIDQAYVLADQLAESAT
jgi:hypothetical protein